MRCDLCGRATRRKTLAPTWWPHEVCERPRCRTAAREALIDLRQSRERFDALVQRVAIERGDHKALPVGWRSDTMAKIELIDRRTWWFNEVEKDEHGTQHVPIPGDPLDGGEGG